MSQMLCRIWETICQFALGQNCQYQPSMNEMIFPCYQHSHLYVQSMFIEYHLGRLGGQQIVERGPEEWGTFSRNPASTHFCCHTSYLYIYLLLPSQLMNFLYPSSSPVDLRPQKWANGGYSFVSTSSQLGEGNGTPLQHSCLENPMDRGALWAAVHRVAKSQK